ncbi:transcriptional regulator [Streptomyces sp. SID8366]|uniref:transcriptional regulator n=1 Tax=unclassified Streptomyces TaxID=2593676 RepID=UPI000DB95476|nr:MULTISPECIES: transcriptional regulator [unclassified Streptomyces]MYU06229.1 transcriptional regulator [Streptomyces sp. SID8366]MYU63720.1 transcriptional regulator [Streptomyces sp. SID69]
MTMVRTPPPLPVRDKAAARALSPMLNRLAEERATGVLVREHGTLYLAEGRVVHAESPLAPGLDVLLTAHGTLAAAAWQRAAAAAEGPLHAAELLLESGLLPSGALELCHLDALYDAGYFALAPSSTPGRFHYEGAPRTGPLPSVPVVALERETLRRRLQLHRLWPDPAADTAPLIRADPLPRRDTGPCAPAGPARRTPVAPRQRAVLDRVDGTRTAADIARELGRQAFHTLVDVRRLAAAGHLGPLAPAAPVPVPVPAAPPPTAPEQARNLPPPLPPVTDPDIALLKRLRDALEAL